MKIKKVSVVDQVSEALKDNILNHTWEPGDKLPSEGDLADTFGVNRLSVRMALQKLNTLGLLETRVGDGTYVRKFSMAPYMNEIADIYMDEKHLNDVRELRNLLEGEAMRIAVSSSTEEEREELRQCYEQYEEKRSQLKEDVDNERLMDELAEADFEFHHQVIRMSHNDLYIDIYLMTKRQSSATYVNCWRAGSARKSYGRKRAGSVRMSTWKSSAASAMEIWRR